MADEKEKRVELILQQLQQLPTLPAVAVKVFEVTGRDESSARQVVDLIASDPSLSAKILRLVHRADLGVRGDVTTIDRAVILLGFDTVRSAVLAVSVFQALDNENSAVPSRFNREEFWKHCLAVACCAELLAGDVSGVDPSEAFVCGLLHDLGKVALDTMLPKSFDRVVEAAELLRGNIADVERTVVGLDHMVVGKRLAERWQLPAVIRDCIWLHGQAPDALPPTVKNGGMINLITLADAVVRQQHLGYSGNYAFPIARPVLLAALGLNEEHIRRVEESLIPRIQEKASLLGLGQTSSGELYLSALTRANEELGRMSQQLATKNRRLAIRAKFFDTLAQFQGELRADAPPATVLQAVAQTAASVLGVAPVAAFSSLPAQALAEVILTDEHGDVVGTSLTECPAKLDRPSNGVGPVLPAGEEMEWLLNVVSPRLAGDHRYWICLEAEGACIGGVLWGSAAGDGQRLSPQASELVALAAGWSLALRTAQIREESRTLAEQLAEANRKLQAANTELLRSRTLASVGEMAAGAAHEMNNPLAVIAGRSQLLASQISDVKLKQSANTIAEQSVRLSGIITDLMEFAKPVPPQPRQTDLAEVIERAIYEAKSMHDGPERKLEMTMSELPPVVVDPQQIQAALCEVLHNAMQATDDEAGRITVHAAYDAFSSRVVVNITDNGRGMDEETLKRAFDPFFSSMPAGRRRGLGLAKAMRWVESSGGSIRLESNVQRGTRAMVLLPAAWPVVAGAGESRRVAAGG